MDERLVIELDRVPRRGNVQERSKGRDQGSDKCHDARNERPHKALYVGRVMASIVCACWLEKPVDMTDLVSCNR